MDGTIFDPIDCATASLGTLPIRYLTPHRLCEILPWTEEDSNVTRLAPRPQPAVYVLLCSADLGGVPMERTWHGLHHDSMRLWKISPMTRALFFG